MRSINICGSCVHLLPGEVMEPGEVLPRSTCAAFPEGIPHEIWHGLADHRQKIAQEPLVYEMREGREAILRLYEDTVQSETAPVPVPKLSGPTRGFKV